MFGVLAGWLLVTTGASATTVGFGGVIPGIGVTHKLVQSMRARKFQDLVKQETDFSCAAASLATILKYAYNLNVTEQDMLEGLFAVSNPDTVRRQGFSLLNVKHYLEKVGFRGRGYQLKPDTLEQLRIPTIVLLDIAGYKHFVVLKKVKNNRAYIADPALGNKVLEKEEFLGNWNGVVFAVIGGGLNRNSVLISPPEPLTARNLGNMRAPLTDIELLDFGFTHAELF